MQTFLPYPDYYRSAQCLDPSRLGNQMYREGLTLLRGKWANPPASKMWAGSRAHLCRYLLACCDVLAYRGLPYPQHRAEILRALATYADTEPNLPAWLGCEYFHAAHRSSLLGKDPDHYSQFGWTEPLGIPYYWPADARTTLNPIDASEMLRAFGS